MFTQIHFGRVVAARTAAVGAAAAFVLALGATGASAAPSVCMPMTGGLPAYAVSGEAAYEPIGGGVPTYAGTEAEPEACGIGVPIAK